MDLLQISIDAGRFIAVCVIITLAGCGLLRLLRLSTSEPSQFLIAPITLHACWAFTLGAAVVAGTSVRPVAIVLAAVTIGLAAYGLPAARDASRNRTGTALLALCAALAAAVTLPYFAFGLASFPGSGHPDGWSYVAYGQYLWTYPRGTEGGLAPLYQYASHLSHTRHVGAGELGVLSLMTSPGDTQSATGLFLATTVFVYAASCAAFATSRRLAGFPLLVYLSAAVFCGWVLNALTVNNFDNLLALGYLPAFASLASRDTPTRRGEWMLAGALAAGIFYTYPEFAMVVLGGASVMFAERCWRTKDRGWPIGLAVAAAIVLVIAGPYLAEFLRFLNSQFAIGSQTSGPRPGEGSFAGLVIREYVVSAFWALGGELQARAWLPPGAVLGGCLFGLFSLGVIRLAVGREAGLLATLLVALTGASFLIVGAVYSYGAYKMILLSWWLLTFTAVHGASWLASLQPPGNRAAVAAGLTICSAIPLVAAARVGRSLTAAPVRSIADYRLVSKVEQLAAGRPIGMFVEDVTASYWAAYFLRDAKVRVGRFDGYFAMPHVAPLINHASPVQWPQVRLLLTDDRDPGPFIERQSWTPLWKSGAFTLWDTGQQGWAVVTEATTPNGFERVEGRPFFWVGGGDTQVTIVANTAGTASLSATFVVGPSVVSRPERCVALLAAPLRPQVVAITPGQESVFFPVPAGESRWTLRPVDRPTVLHQPNGDTRALILGVDRPEVSFSRKVSAAVIATRSAPNEAAPCESMPGLTDGVVQ